MNTFLFETNICDLKIEVIQSNNMINKAETN